MSIFRRRLLASQQLLWQDLLSPMGTLSPCQGGLPKHPWQEGGSCSLGAAGLQAVLLQITGICTSALGKALATPALAQPHQPSTAWKGVNGKETLPEHLHWAGTSCLAGREYI